MPKFSVGQLVITNTIHTRIAKDEEFARFINLSIQRHMAGDWGELCDDDRVANEEALKHGSRLFSVYKAKGMPKIYIITEADRSSTCVLFPSDY